MTSDRVLMPDQGREAIILEMIARQCDLRRILDTLCRQAGHTPEERQVAFFLLEKGRWVLVATGDLSLEAEEILTEVDPEAVSASLFGGDSVLRDSCGVAIGRFRGRHLYSGIGEMLGLFLCLGACASADFARNSTIESVCRLAALAIEHRNLLEELTWQAEHDAVTGLRTRTCFERALSTRIHAFGEPPTAFLCINLDRFRLVNGVLGHSLGNRMLKYVGSRLRSCLLPDDLIARIGGDEFGVLTPVDRAALAAEKIIASLRDPFSLDEHELYIGASIGIGCAGETSTAESLQREAYVALYHAKRGSKGGWTFFQPSMAAIPPERLEMEKCLRSALANREMALHYQPQLDLATGTLRGAEALLRWHPRGLGSISPTAFIPILEETGLIVEIGLWVLAEACRQGVRWLSERTPLRVAVNVSAVQFLDPGFVPAVEQVLRDTGYPPSLLEFELTESLFIQDFDRARAVFSELQKIGIQFALDDFGTGQSSLSYLRELPFQRLKIDRAFIVPITEGEKCRPLVENMIHMGASLGMTAIAEGIDSPDQLEILRTIGCDEGQGFLFSTALPPAEFRARWLSRPTSPDVPVSDIPQGIDTHHALSL